MRPRTHSHHCRRDALVLILLMGLAAALGLSGIKGDLPHVAEADEPVFVVPAVTMARTGDLNPRWFGHPGSTVIYPLAGLARALDIAAFERRLVPYYRSMAQPPPFPLPELYLLGRLLALAYLVLSIPLVYAVGRRAFGRRAALLGAAFLPAMPLPAEYAIIVRTDSAALLFTLLALWAILRVYERPTLVRNAAAGAAIGLAVATRYFMLALPPALLAADVLAAWRETRAGLDGRREIAPVVKSNMVGLGVGALACVAAFAITTPYFFSDFQRVLSDLSVESRSSHLGADGLNFAGNLLFYVTDAIPDGMSLPLALLALLGIVLTLRGLPGAQRRAEQLILLAFAATLLVAMSTSHLHWVRWTIQVLPVLGLFAASALVAVVDWITSRARTRAGAGTTQGAALQPDADSQAPPPGPAWLLVAAAVLVCAPALLSTTQAAAARHAPSTHLRAREWLLKNVPPGSHVATEHFSAPLLPEDLGGFVEERRRGPSDASGFVVLERHTLSDRPLSYYRDEGFEYVVVSGAWFGPILANPEERPQAAAFYSDLTTSGDLLAEFGPSHRAGGPLIRVYRLGE